MIQFKQNSITQYMALTCSELATLSNPFFLFVFTHEATKEVQKIVLTDLSQYKRRYNLFQIAGTFFAHSGWYIFDVYEQSNFNNTNISNTKGRVETGRAFVTSSAEVEFVENKNSETKFKEYNG